MKSRINSEIDKDNDFNTYQIFYQAEAAQNVLSVLYENASFYLDRKYFLYKKVLKWKCEKGVYKG